MSHELIRLRDSLDNTPLLATQALFDSVTKYLDSRNTNMAIKTDGSKPTPWQADVNNGVAILDVAGALTYRATSMEAMCGGMSYETLYSRYMSSVEAGANTVVFSMASGGGSAMGVFDVSTMIRQHATDNNIKLLTYVDELCASACFAIGAISDEVIIAPDATIGSVGVVMALRDTSEQDKKEGVSTLYIYEGENKIPFDAEGKFTDAFKAGMQAKCAALYNTFTEHIAMYSGMTQDAVKALGANTFMGSEAVDVGYADKVMSRQEFANYLNSSITKPKEKPMLSKIFNKGASLVASQQEGVDMELQAQLEQLQTSLSDLQASHAELGAALQAALADKSKAEADLAAFLAEDATKAANARLDRIKAAYGDEQANTIFESIGALPDAAFEAVVAAQEAATEKLAASNLFVETGVSAEAEIPAEASSLQAVAAALKARRAKSK